MKQKCVSVCRTHATLEKYRWAENNLDEGTESILSQAWSITESLQYTTSNSSPLKFLTLLAQNEMGNPSLLKEECFYSVIFSPAFALHTEI